MVHVRKEYMQTLFSAHYVKKMIHKRCSGVRCELSRVADGFRCWRYDGPILEVDLAEDLKVDRETYECVKSFCYLGDTLDGDGGADIAATAGLRNGWIKFGQLLPFLTSRALPLVECLPVVSEAA